MDDANVRTKVNAKAAEIAWGTLLGFIVVVIAAGFALTFHGIYGYGRDIAHWGPVLAALGPIADDGLTLVAIAAAWLLTTVRAPRRPRVYAWSVFAFSCAASIAGNTAYAMRPLPVWSGAIGAALCPVFVTLAAHLGVVCWRYWQGRAVQQTAPVSAPTTKMPTPTPASTAETPRTLPPRKSHRAGGDMVKVGHREQARELYASGVGVGEILKRWNGTAPARRTVEIWTRDLRDEHSRARASLTGQVPGSVDTSAAAAGGGNGHGDQTR